MRVQRRVTLALIFSLAPAMALAQQSDRRPGIAVLPFAKGISIGPEKEDLEGLEVGLQQILITELAQNPALRVVERGIIRELMEEQDLGASGRVDAGTAARVGKIVGARYVFTGGFNDVSGNMRLDGHIVDVETSEILRAQQVSGDREGLYELVVDLASRITGDVDLPPLPEPVREARKEREVPREAVVLYSRAQFYQDRGEMGRARELYRRVVDTFPQFTEAKVALAALDPTGD